MNLLKLREGKIIPTHDMKTQKGGVAPLSLNLGVM